MGDPQIARFLSRRYGGTAATASPPSAEYRAVAILAASLKGTLMFSTRTFAAATTAALLAIGAVAAATPANASTSTSTLAPTVLTCQGSEVDSYSPALTNTPKNIAVKSSARHTCLGVSNPAVTTANVDFSILQSNYSCSSVLRNGDGTATIKWSNGKTSTFQFSGMVNIVDGTLVTTQTGTLTSGLFTGSAAVRVITGPQLGLLECAGQGVSTRTGTSLLTIGGLS